MQHQQRRKSVMQAESRVSRHLGQVSAVLLSGAATNALRQGAGTADMLGAVGCVMAKTCCGHLVVSIW
jgi:hypothetical protein